jgi:hypothetical protein
MKPPLRSPTRRARLSNSMHHQLRSYSVVASAAGVGLLALAQPSEAKIVYTKTHQVIGTNGVYPLDLNHDGVIDFLIQQAPASVNPRLTAQGAFGNAVEGTGRFAAALKKGAAIGPRQRFVSSSAVGEYMAVHFCTETGRCYWSGQWINVTNEYLGLRFEIDGKTHYGWARISTQTQELITATLTGYAYETVPDKGIRAGQTIGASDAAKDNSDSKQSEISDPATPLVNPVSQAIQIRSLGWLALGAMGIALWRRP